jgi:hypothetical protein
MDRNTTVLADMARANPKSQSCKYARKNVCWTCDEFQSFSNLNAYILAIIECTFTTDPFPIRMF